MSIFTVIKNLVVSKPKEVITEVNYNGYNVFNQSIADAMVQFENYKPGKLYTKEIEGVTTEQKTYFKNPELTIIAMPGYYSVGTKETGVTQRIVLDSKGTTFKTR